MGNYTTNLFKTPEVKRLPVDRGLVSFNRESDDQSFSASCHHSPSTGSEATLGDEWFNYEMLEYYIPTPRKAKVNRCTKRAKTRAKQICVVPLLTNVVDSGSTVHTMAKKYIAAKSPSAPAVLLSSPSTKRPPEKNVMFVKSIAWSSEATTKRPRWTVPSKHSTTGVLDGFASASNVNATPQETASDTSLLLSQDVALRPIARFQSTWLSSSAPAALMSELPPETSLAEPANVTSDATTSDLTGEIQTGNNSKCAAEIISAKKSDSELDLTNESSLTQIKSKRVTEGCLGRTATQLLATFRSCIGIGSNGLVGYSVSYILKSPSSHENLIHQA